MRVRRWPSAVALLVAVVLLADAPGIPPARATPTGPGSRPVARTAQVSGPVDAIAHADQRIRDAAPRVLPEPTPAPPAPPTAGTTPYSQWSTDPTGQVTTRLFGAPAFRRSGAGWSAIDTSVVASIDGRHAAVAEGALRPVRFGRSAADLVELELLDALVTVSATDLRIASPRVRPDGVDYDEVATDTDLRYTVTPYGVKEEVVLRSQRSPRSFRFHVADPKGRLGRGRAVEGGGYRFDNEIEDGVVLEISAPFAFEALTASAASGTPSPLATPQPLDPTSAHMTVERAGDGVDVEISVDPTWLEGKQFPIVLDPTLVFSRANGTLVAGLNAYVAGGCGGGCGTNTTSADLTAGTYATSSGTTTARSFFRFDLASIPPAAISSATLGLHTVACLGPSYWRCGSNSYSVQLHRMTGSWSSSSTWNQLATITDASAFSASSVPAFSIYSGCFGCFWTYFDMAAQVQRWVDGTQANHGFAARLGYEGPDVGGPVWSYLGSYGATYANLPYLEVTYTPRPGPPRNVTAWAGNELVDVLWDAPTPNGGPAPTSYTATLHDATTGMAVAQQSCGVCIGLRFTRLVNGRSYFAKVYATNSAGDGPPATSPTVSPVAYATATELFGDANPAQLDPTCRTPLGANCATGNLWWSHANLELHIPGRGVPLAFVPGYNSLADWRAGPLGNGWTHSYNMTLEFDLSGDATVYQENASSVRFSPDGAGGYRTTSNVLAALVKNPDGSFSFTRHQDLQRFVFSAAGKLLSVADHNGYTTNLTYSGGLLSAVTDPAGRSLSLTYSGSKLSAVTDPAGRALSFTYGATGDLATIVDVGGGVWRFTFDDGHHPLSITDPNGGVLRNTFDGYCRVTSQEDNGRLTLYSYGPGSLTVTDARGSVSVAQHSYSRLVSLVEASGTAEAGAWSYGYDPATMGVVSATDPNGRTATASWDGRGNLLTASDALSRRSSFTYTAANRVLTATDPTGVTTTNTYDVAANLTASSRPLTSTGQAATTRYGYDPVRPGDLTSVTDPTNRTTTFAYDAFGNRVRSTDGLGNATTLAYDGIGRMTSSTTPAGRTTTTSYNAFGQPLSRTDPLGNTTTWAYDAKANRISETDANGRVTAFAHNASDELIALTHPGGAVERTGYDAAGNVASRTDELSHVTTYAYDRRNRRTSATDPLGRTTRYGYDKAGNPTTLTDASGRVTTHAYDAAHQRTSTTYSGGSTPAVLFRYDANGRRTLMVDGSGASAYAYDSLGRLTAHANGAGANVVYRYDLAGRLTSIAYPAPGQVVTRSYDGAGRLAGVSDWLGHTTTFGYDADANLVRLTYPNGVVTDLSHDGAGRVSSVLHRRGPTELLDLPYGRDRLGLVTREAGRGFGYDARNRLVSATSPTIAYGYNGAGSLTAMSTAGSHSTTMDYDAADQLSSLTTTPAPATGASYAFSYDPQGNRIVKTTSLGAPLATYAYDQANRLVSASGAGTYTYDGDGLRTAKTGAAQAVFTWAVAEGLPLLLHDGANAYITGPDGLPLAQVDQAGQVLYYHADQLGSTRLLTDSTGAVAATYDYDPYGNPAASTTTSPTLTNPLRFAGQYTDAETGFVYLRARYYDPATGQFLTRDPVEGGSCNDYDYVCGDPVNQLDLDGRMLLRRFCLFGFGPGCTRTGPTTTEYHIGNLTCSAVTPTQERCQDLRAEAERILGRSHNPARVQRYNE